MVDNDDEDEDDKDNMSPTTNYLKVEGLFSMRHFSSHMFMVNNT